MIQLDVVRGIAILLVMQFHFLTASTQVPLFEAFDRATKRVGWTGVDLFFVLSGFLVGGLLIKEMATRGEIDTPRFLLRRMFKIWPPYYFYIFAQILFHLHPWKSFVWQNLLNIQNYAGTSLNHTWSLAVEEHFYLFLPLLLNTLGKNIFLRTRIPQVLISISALVLIGRIVTVDWIHWTTNLQWLTHARLDSLLFGVLLAYLFTKNPGRIEQLLALRPWLALLALSGLAFCFYAGAQSHLMWTLGYTFNYISLGAFALLIYSYKGRFCHTWVYRGLAQIGIYSYGIYLWHLSVRAPLASAIKHLPTGLQWPGLFLAQNVAAIVLGIAVTKAVEAPMLRLREHLFPPRVQTFPGILKERTVERPTPAVMLPQPTVAATSEDPVSAA